MTVTADTPWRETGDTTEAGLIAEFGRRSVTAGTSWMTGYLDASPLIAEAAAIRSAAGGLARLVAAMGLMEQQHATVPDEATASRLKRDRGIQPTLTTIVPNANRNHLSIKLRHTAAGPEWRVYPSYAACVADWLTRLTDPDGPYAETVTIRQMLDVYAPANDGNVPETYARTVCDVINRIPLAGSSSVPAGQGGTPVPATSTITFGNVEAPPVNRRDIDPGLNTAFDRLGARRGLFVVLHRMYGTLWGTDTFFRTDARIRARTDYGVDHVTGEILRWTDPLGDLSPYASGPYTAPPGDGIALVAKLGQLAINRDGISIEVAGFNDDPVSATAFERTAQLIAYWADWNEIPYPSWPINPKTGLTFVYWHGEFDGGKGPGTLHDCPGRTLRNRTTELIDRVGQILREAQAVETATPSQPARPPRIETPVAPGAGGGPNVTEPRPSRPPTAIALPAGVDLAMVSGWFGSVTSNGDRAMSFGFDPTGPVTKLWLEHGRTTGEWPQLASVTETVGGRLFRFDGGWTVRGSADGTVEEVGA